jgi:MFS family permease
VYVALVTSVGRLVPTGQRATGQALLQTTLMGVAPIIGASLGGFGFEHWPPAVLFDGAAVLAVLGAVTARAATGSGPPVPSEA